MRCLIRCSTFHGLHRSLMGTRGSSSVPQLDIYYLHSVDEHAVLDETLSVVDQLHRRGTFRRFGLSNFSAWQTTQVYYKCKEEGWVLPTVYQGLYNPLSRSVQQPARPMPHRCVAACPTAQFW